VLFCSGPFAAISKIGNFHEVLLANLIRFVDDFGINITKILNSKNDGKLMNN